MLLGVSWSRFGAPLASFWVILGSLGPVLGRLGLSWARFRPLRGAFWSPITLYAHQFINSSTVQPMACQHFATRAGGLRAERLNLPSCERKAELSNVFRYLQTFVMYLFVLFVQKRIVSENRLHLTKHQRILLL